MDLAKHGKTKVDMVQLDDNKMFVDTLSDLFVTRGKIVNKYHDLVNFLAKLSQYAKDTKICMDYDLQNNMNGIELSKRLHKKGYTKLYLLSSKNFTQEELPSYLVAISKIDIENIYKLME